MKSQVLFMFRGGETSRFHTLRTIQQDNVAQHSFGVAHLCQLINPQCSKNLILAALEHDLAEQVTGDMPAPSKRELGVSLRMSELEDEILHRAGFGVPLTEEEARILKLADCFQGMLFCIRERSLGNRGVEAVFGRYRGYVLEKLRVNEDSWITLFDQLWKDAENGQF